MKNTSKDEILDINQALKHIEEIIINGELPKNLAGDLMSQSFEEFHRKLSKRLANLQAQLR